MAGNLIQITDAGRAALVAAGNTGTVAHQVVEIGLGTAAFAFDKGMKILPNERKRVTTFGGENVAPDTVHVVIQDDSNDQYSLYAYGLYLDNGVLFGVYVQDTPILEKSPAAMLLLTSDIVFTSIDAAQLQFGPTTFLNPPATTERKGVAELATQAEVDAGADDTRIVTPKKAAARYAALTGAAFSGPVSVAGTDAGGAHVRAIGGEYGAFLRVDGKTAALLSTKQGDTIGTSNGMLPFYWSLLTGKVTIDGTGRGAEFGGAVEVAGDLSVGQSAAEAHIRLGPIDGYLYSSAQSVGFWSPTKGAFQYLFADRTFRIDGKLTWHEGNLDPLDKTKGGTLGGDLTFAAGKRLVLAEGSLASPSLTFANDGAPDTGLYHSGDGQFGVTCNGASVVRFTSTLAAFDQTVTGPTPPTGDRSTRLATTEWVLTAISTTTVGQIVFEPRTTARAGFLKANGAAVNRTDYPALWAYAQASGALVSEAEWNNGRWGCFSTGDGTTTFRLPEMRGEFIRCWSDGRNDIDPQRAIGSYQGDQNRSHAHGASSSEVGDHAHSAWSDGAGFHGHDVNDPGHAHPTPSGYYTNLPGNQVGATGSPNTAVGNGTLGAQTGIGIAGNGHHIHNISVGAGGRHSHGITINADGGNEARPRNVALLAMIRAY
ncbi:tail fiber protein [Burkholderia glumae]|uniref:phage tail protein n=1 Tax=Burkholderia glumae TaxID=337 RepID=UPI000F5DE38A|nr:phage tail protein [Burkholderia glumae]RQZ68156.1 tail fiber protein [Burkholderia glumae]